MENYLGEIRIFPYSSSMNNGCPAGWVPCSGQILQTGQYQALYSLLGNMFGGTAPNTFALPDLRGRAMLGTGVAKSGTTYVQGNAGGSEGVALVINQMPLHNHTLSAMNSNGAFILNTTTPAETLAIPAIKNVTDLKTFVTTGNVAPLIAGSMANTGNDASHENRVPLLALNVCIAIQGVYPSRT